MFLKNDSKFSRNLKFLKVITVLLCLLLAAGSVAVGVILLLQPGTEMLYIGIGVAAGGAVIFIMAMFIILSCLNVKGSMLCDIKLIRNKLYGNDNSALRKYIGNDASLEVLSAPDQLATTLTELIESLGASLQAPAPTPVPVVTTAPVSAPAPAATPAPAARPAAPAARPAVKTVKPEAKRVVKKHVAKPAVNTAGVDPAEVAKLDALLEKGTITPDMYKQMIDSKRKK